MTNNFLCEDSHVLDAEILRRIGKFVKRHDIIITNFCPDIQRLEPSNVDRVLYLIKKARKSEPFFRLVNRYFKTKSINGFGFGHFGIWIDIPNSD